MLQNRLRFILLCIGLLHTTGCSTFQSMGKSLAAIPKHIGERANHRAALMEQKRLDKEAVHEAELLAMKTEREQLRASRDALIAEYKRKNERELKRQQVRSQLKAAEDELVSEATEPRIKNQLNSQLQMNFGQSLKLGELQVNVDKLKELIEKRDLENKFAKEQFSAQQKRNRSQLTEQAANCASPLADKLRARSQLNEAPPERPILPTEVPLMLPVNLVLEMGSPNFGNPTVKQIPVAPRAPLTDFPECKTPDRSRLTEPPCDQPCCPTCPKYQRGSNDCPRCDVPNRPLVQPPPAPPASASSIRLGQWYASAPRE